MQYTFQFGPNTNRARKRQLGPGVLVNAYVEKLEEPGKDDVTYVIIADPGLRAFSSFSGLGDTFTRGLFQIAETSLYTVAGEHLYKVNSGGANTLIGTVAGSTPVITSVNRAVVPQVVITADATVYQMAGDTLQTFQDADLGDGVVGTCFLDGYTIILLRSGIFQITGLNDLSIDPLDFAEAEAKGDEGVLPVAFESKLYLGGQKTIEVWSDTGAAAFPFERDTVIPRGFMSKYAVAEFDETLAFVDDLARVVRLVGYTVSVISNADVERDIRRTVDLSQQTDLEMFAWATGGHQFLVLTGHDWTWVYDAATKLWHSKEAFLTTKWKGRGYLRAFNKHIVGSFTEGKVYEMHHDIYEEAGEPLIKRLRSPIIGNVGVTTEFNQLDLDVAMAVGLLSSDDNEADPKVQLRWSDDGGKTWSNSRIKSMGRIGEVGSGKIRFSRMGTCMNGRGRIFELTMSHPVERMTLECICEIEELPA